MGKTNRCGSTEPGRSQRPKQQKRARKHMTHTCHCRKRASQPFHPVLNCSPSRPPGNYLSIRMERRLSSSGDDVVPSPDVVSFCDWFCEPISAEESSESIVKTPSTSRDLDAADASSAPYVQHEKTHTDQSTVGIAIKEIAFAYEGVSKNPPNPNGAAVAKSDAETVNAEN